jgi:plasmid stabilization system protein ParE
MPSALRDLRRAGAYIAKDDPVVAEKVLARIRETTLRLASRPHIGRPGRARESRELVIAQLHYVVVYRAGRDRVEIIRVIHTSRMYP